MMLGFGQMMCTPTNKTRSDSMKKDRPFAGALMFSLGCNARLGDTLPISQMRIGMMVPASLVRQTQNWWDDIIGAGRFHGGGYQLRNEPVLRLIHERRKRVFKQETASDWGWDLTRHWRGQSPWVEDFDAG